MKKHIICYGDSNTHGYDGDSGQRFSEQIRWTKILQEKFPSLDFSTMNL